MKREGDKFIDGWYNTRGDAMFAEFSLEQLGELERRGHIEHAPQNVDEEIATVKARLEGLRAHQAVLRKRWFPHLP